MSKKINISLSDVWTDAFHLIKNTPYLLFPLSIVAFLEALYLELLYFGPRFPLNSLFLPPIRRFFGEGALHYPTFLFFVPKLFGFGQILLFIFAGGVLTAVTVVLTASVSQTHPLRFSVAWKKVRIRLIPLILASLFIVILLKFITGREIAFFRMAFDFAGRGPLYRSLQILAGITPYLNFFIALAIQAFIVFIFPFLVLENKGIFPAIGRSFAIGGRHFLRVYALLLLPTLLYSPFWFFKGHAALLVRKTLYPESILWLLGLGILATLLADTFIAVSSTLFFLRVRSEKSA